jgi:small conductance mechanosensitive channel
MFDVDLKNYALLNQQNLELLMGYFTQIFAGIFTLFVGFWLSSRASRLTINSLSKIDRLDSTLVPLLGSLVRYAGMTLALVVALGNFGIETTSIIAVLGAAGLAIGLALQGTLSNVAAGLMLILLRPFKTGDWIEAAGVSGSVREIGLFATIIDTFDKIYISVPNSAIWSSNIINHAKYDTRRMDLDIGISYDTNLDDAEKALLELAKDSRILIDPTPQFLVVSYADSSIVVRLRLHTSYSNFFQLQYDLNRQLKTVFEKHNISIPYPHRVIHRVNIDDQISSSNDI